jgi:hypothetical protein
MTNPGDSDEWWKQYGGEGVSSESGATAAAPPPSTPLPYASNPRYPDQPMPPQAQSYPSYPQPTPPPQPYTQPGYGPAPAYQPYGYPQARSFNGLAIGSLIASLVGLATCGVGSIVGIILGVVALNQVKQRNQDGRGMALAGIWVGVGIITLWVLYFVIIIVIAANSHS